MKVKDLRSQLAAFDDDVEVLAAPQIRMEFAGRGLELNVPHPLEQFTISKLHIVGHVEQGTGDVTERCVVLAFEQPDAPPEMITEELRKKFIRFREAYQLAQSMLVADGLDPVRVDNGAWEIARRAEMLTADELDLFRKMHNALLNVKRS